MTINKGRNGIHRRSLVFKRVQIAISFTLYMQRLNGQYGSQKETGSKKEEDIVCVWEECHELYLLL